FADETDPEKLWQILQHRISSVFGIANYALALSSSIDPTGDLTRLKEVLGPAVQSQQFQSFRVTTKRGDKRFPKTSMDVSQEVGGYIQKLTGSQVDLTNPDLTIYLELLFESAFASFAKMPGPGGLTLGMSGKTVCLLSGGIDSPVAAYRMMKRGCHQIFVHFHSHPFVSRASQEKAEDLAAHLTQYQYRSVLYLIPFGDIQRQIVLSVPPPLRIVLYRRFMIRIAEQIAHRHRAARSHHPAIHRRQPLLRRHRRAHRREPNPPPNGLRPLHARRHEKRNQRRVPNRRKRHCRR
ncbi:MAG TPA: hypothetical protein EYQ81_12910, partial [Sneathiellales bacterium]|nr:hypothetical protein [Sneathiellales bacterium]